MEIRINEDWKIGSDPLNIILYERKVNKSEKSKNFGVEYWVEQGFYRDLEQGLEGFYRRSSLRSNAKDWVELNEEIKRIHQTITDAVGGVDKGIKLLEKENKKLLKEISKLKEEVAK